MSQIQLHGPKQILLFINKRSAEIKALLDPLGLQMLDSDIKLINDYKTYLLTSAEDYLPEDNNYYHIFSKYKAAAALIRHNNVVNYDNLINNLTGEQVTRINNAYSEIEAIITDIQKF